MAYKIIQYKEKYNKEHGIIPQTLKKEIREAIHGQENVDEAISLVKKGKKAKKKDKETLIKDLVKIEAGQRDFKF